MGEQDQNDRSSQPKKTFHPFFKPNAGIKRDHASSSDVSSDNTTNDRDPPKIKLKKSSTFKSLWTPSSHNSQSNGSSSNSKTTQTPIPTNQQQPVPKSTSPSTPLHPFFSKRLASTTSKPSVNKEKAKSTMTKQEKRPNVQQQQQPLPPLPPPLKKKRNNDYRNEPLWPEKAVFEGGHIGVPSRQVDNHELQQNTVTSRIPSSSTVLLNYQQQQKKRSHHLHDIIQNESARYFTSCSQKQQQRSITTPRPKKQPKVHSMSIQQIQRLIESMYPSCKNSPACQGLLDKMVHKTNKRRLPSRLCSNNNNIPWTERYRPNKIQELLGNQEDNLYLRDWLYQMKVAAPSTLDTLSSSHHKKKKKASSTNKSKRLLDTFLQDPLAYAAMVEDQEDDDFVPSGGGGRKSTTRLSRTNNNKKKKQRDTTIAMQSNLILLVGDYGSGKTSAVYTAAEEAGYQVFEIHPGIKRSGKELISYVGEMTESHLVTSHPMSSNNTAAKKKNHVIHREKDEAMDNQQFMRQFAATKITSESDVIQIDDDPLEQEEEDKENNHSRHTDDNNEGDDLMEIDQFGEEPKQSLVLLEEVDMLYDEDKGFWSSVVDLAQKSKRPIVLTCNDRNLIPTELLFLQGILEYRYPDIEELMAYLHLICFSEGYLVDPVDLAGLVAATKKDLRLLVNTLELWCTENRSTTDIMNTTSVGEESLKKQELFLLYECPHLFERYTATCQGEEDGLDSNPYSQRIEQLFHIQQPISKSGVDLVRFYDTCLSPHHRQETGPSHPIDSETKEGCLLKTMKQLERATWGDILMNASIRQNYQVYIHKNMDLNEFCGT
ncbi:hypothetical protein BDA99DRAFT_252701 [Phascolomyces articulosus]|uniref:AAA+ ATPase domain-containing protein n=1 Tax=Phascolomyces articulosus TaxID=60185 RepID=A0AAD5JP88_9FUNG|nr:hypothetical protein BDA99DRAFT_252701 [Phascolomyces articulosus]